MRRKPMAALVVHQGPDPTRETTPAVLAFLDVAARMATWDAEEGFFPVQSALRQKFWAEEDNSDDDDDEEEEDTNKTAEHESQLAREIEVLHQLDRVQRW